MAAEVLATAGLRVAVYERMPSVGRKFLLAGRSGLNLTHSEPIDRLLRRYGPAAGQLEPAIRAFPPAAVRAWAEGLGQRTYVGSSGRVFPEAMRATPLLRAWLGRLAELGVEFHTRTTWTGWATDGSLCFVTADGSAISATPDATVLSLGGASWPRVGSNGAWAATLASHGVATMPFRPANCGFLVDWPDHFRTAHAGAPVKNIRLTSVADGTTVRGEAVVTSRGIEGGAVYMLSASLRGRDRGPRVGNIARRSPPRSVARRSRHSPRQATRRRLTGQPSPSSHRSVERCPRAGRLRSQQRPRHRRRGSPGRPDQGPADRRDGTVADRPGDLHGGGRGVGRYRRVVDVAGPARRLCHRGDDRLGSPNRRLPAPGDALDGSRRGARHRGMRAQSSRPPLRRSVRSLNSAHLPRARRLACSGHVDGSCTR